MRATIPVFDLTLRQSIATLAVLIGRAPAELTVKGGSLFKLATPRVTPGLPSELLRAGLDIVTLLQAERAWYQQERHPPRWHSVRQGPTRAGKRPLKRVPVLARRIRYHCGYNRQSDDACSPFAGDGLSGGGI